MAIFHSIKLARSFVIFVLLPGLGLGTAMAAVDDLGECAGYLRGSILSEGISPPSLEWEALDSEGPDNGPCIASGLLWKAGDPSIAQLTVTGPGVLSFEWLVSSKPNDGWLSCQIGQAGGIVEAGRISGDTGQWVPMTVFIPQGERTISWIYRKVTSEYEGDDIGKVANVGFSPIAMPPQSFDDYKTAHGVTGEGSSMMSGRRLDSSWLMGLAPDAPTPVGVGVPIVDGANIRFRMIHSLSATAMLTPLSSEDLNDWDGMSLNSQIMPSSPVANTVMIEFTTPAVGRKFFKTSHQSQVTPPPGFSYIPSGSYLAGSPPSEVGRIWTGYVSGNHGGEEDYLHQVTLTKGFFIKKHETTFAEWEAVRTWARANGYPSLDVEVKDIEGVPTPVDIAQNGGRHLLQASGGNLLNSASAVGSDFTHPATNIGFYTALKWLNAKSEMEGKAPCYYVRLNEENGGAEVVWRDEGFDVIGNDLDDLFCDWDANGYRVPTEAEWEYACRAGTLTALSNGLNLTHGKHYAFWPQPGVEVALNDPNLNGIGSYFGNTAATHPVGSMAPNPFGLYDMHGNAAEWCWDRFNTLVPQQFSGEALIDPKGPVLGIYRVVKGGDWRNPGHMLRSATRLATPSGGGRHHGQGLRFALNAPE